MGQTTGNLPPLNPFADFVARRQYEEERRRAAQFSPLGVGLRPFAGATSALAEGGSNTSDKSLLRTTDDTTPLRLTQQTSVRNYAAPDTPGPTRADSLLHPASAPSIAAPLIAGAATAALPAEIIEALGGPIGWGLLALTLGATYALSRSSHSVDSPDFGGSSGRGGIPGGPPASIIPPQPGFPATPFPHSLPPTPPSLPAEKPVFENIPPKIDAQSPPFPVIDDDLLEERIRAGSKTPWADAYPEVLDWIENVQLNSKGNEQTQDDNETIIKTFVEGFRKRNVVAKHVGGGRSLPEKYYGDPEKKRLGSGRPDGSFTVGSEDEPYDFNTHDTWKDGRTPTARERAGKTNLERLRELYRQKRMTRGDSSKQGRFDMFPKSRNFSSRADWERHVRQLIDDLLDQEFGPPSE